MSAAEDQTRQGEDVPATVYAWTDSSADHTYLLPAAAVLGRVREDVRQRRRLCKVPFVWCVAEARRPAGQDVEYYWSPGFRAEPSGPLAFRMKVVLRRCADSPVRLQLVLSGEPKGRDRKDWRVAVADYAPERPAPLASRALAFADQLNHLVFDALPLDPPAGAPDMLVVRVETGPVRPADGEAAPVARSALLAGHMERLLLDAASGGDVVLRAQGHDLRAHRNILSGRSPVFRRMFESAMRESGEGLVVVEDVKFDTLRMLVAYLYSGRIAERPSPEAAMELFAAADRYEVLDLRDGCAEAMLSVATCLPALVLADALGDARLRAAASAFFVARRRDVCGRPDWAAPLAPHPRLMRQLMERMAADDD